MSSTKGTYWRLVIPSAAQWTAGCWFATPTGCALLIATYRITDAGLGIAVIREARHSAASDRQCVGSAALHQLGNGTWPRLCDDEIRDVLPFPMEHVAMCVLQ